MPMFYSDRSQTGFTFIEIVLMVALVAIIGGLSIPFYTTFVTKNYAENATNDLYSALSKAKTYSRAGKGDSDWGVQISTSSFTTFKGSSYASRDTAFDETYTVPETVMISGMNEIVFQNVDAVPSTTGDITISARGKTKILTINPLGTIDIN